MLPTVSTLLWSIQPLPLLSSPCHFSAAFSTHPFIAYFTDVLFFNVTDALSFPFLSPPSPSSRVVLHFFLSEQKQQAGGLGQCPVNRFG
jgi:hypothetical protein